MTNEVLGSVLLISSAILAMVVNNSQFSSLYNNFLDIRLSVSLADNSLDKPLLLWINDGLMAVFFLLVGLELKREILEGELSDFKKVSLPIAGAVGGMLCPIFIYYIFNVSDAEYLKGWAVPMATDIAFALGILALFGKRVPIQLKLFLLTLAIIDDLGAIVVIGLFHTQYISWLALGYAQAIIIILVLCNVFSVRTTSIYLMFGWLLWLCTLKSGFHATIAGVILAFTIPLKVQGNKEILHNLEEELKPLVAFLILPIFSFANSGIPLDNISLNDIVHPIVLGISVGLILGNCIGIFLATFFIKSVLKIKPSFSNLDLLGVALLCGIGFTMSLFISGLSFSENMHLLNLSRLGIMLGSSTSMILGIIVLNKSLPKIN